jgi:hypothetical protein
MKALDVVLFLLPHGSLFSPDFKFFSSPRETLQLKDSSQRLKNSYATEKIVRKRVPKDIRRKCFSSGN